MAYLLALDLGTTTGFAIGQYPAGDGYAVMTGRWRFALGRFAGGGVRYVNFRRQLEDINAAVGIDEVIFEEVRAHKGTDAAHVYGGLLATLTAWCEDQEIPYSAVSVGAIKKFATGKGNASKEAVIAGVKSWGYAPGDDNEADAIALLHLGLVERC